MRHTLIPACLTVRHKTKLGCLTIRHKTQIDCLTVRHIPAGVCRTIKHSIKRPRPKPKPRQTQKPRRRRKRKNKTKKKPRKGKKTPPKRPEKSFLFDYQRIRQKQALKHSRLKTSHSRDQLRSLYNICTILVQYLYVYNCTSIVQVLYIYCTTTSVGTGFLGGGNGERMGSDGGVKGE